MLLTYINSLPFTKFILIEDSLTDKGTPFLSYIYKNHVKKQDYRTIFLSFEGSFKENLDDCKNYDFICDSRNWLNDKENINLRKILSTLKDNCVVIIDSLVHVFYQYGTSETCKILNELKLKENVLQIVTVLHTDLLENNSIVPFLKHIATLHLELESGRVLYTYKKSIRKIVKDLEEFQFTNGELETRQILKPDTEKIRDMVLEIKPENLSTFKIGLTEKDKESKENLVLPYLPKGNEGEIHYTFDNGDDWDEEDPDDDLDI